MEWVTTMKKLFLVYQKNDESIAEYMRNFEVLLNGAEQTGVTPGWYKAMVKIAYVAGENDITGWETPKASNNNVKKKQVKKFGKEGQKQFIAALHFDGLNNITYSDVKKDIHNQ